MNVRWLLFVALLGALTGFSARAFETKEDALRAIEIEAFGIVPKDALAHWIFLQRQGDLNDLTKVPLDPVTEKTLLEIEHSNVLRKNPALRVRLARIFDRKLVSLIDLRAVVTGYLSLLEREMRARGEVSKVRADFRNEGLVLRQLYTAQHPIWYTAQKFSTEEFIGLIAIPQNIGGIAKTAMVADKYELPPLEFLLHDELHAIGLMATQKRELARLGIHPGSIAYYEWVLERVRFTKRFLSWVDTLSDPIEKRIAKILWVDAFREYFPEKAPYRNFSMTQENLNRYLGRQLPKDKILRAYRGLLRFFGKGNAFRFVPGDFLPLDEPNPEQFSSEKVDQVYRKMAVFSGYDPKKHGDRALKAASRSLRNRAYACAYLFMPYEKIY